MYASCVIEYDSPAIVTVPLLEPPALADTVIPIHSSPVPLVLDNDTHDKLSEAVQLQDEAEASTSTSILPPELLKFVLDPESV